jgi:hypothetical protein
MSRAKTKPEDEIIFYDEHGCLPLDEMTPEQFAQWRECYYLGIMCCPFGQEIDAAGHIVYTNVPHGMSIHGVPKLRPEDQ